MNNLPTVVEPSEGLAELRARTPARVALGRSGMSLPTREVLAFGLAHARARDAVHAAMDLPQLRGQFQADGWSMIEVASAAPTRAAYLARPDWGRRLDEQSRVSFETVSVPSDVVFVISDGLSASAIHHHAAALLRELRPHLAALRLAPLVLATQARVALADEIGELIRARVAVSLIGERPGLSSPDSLGAYITAQPRPGRTDAERWCVSNVHGAGLAYAEAAVQIAAKIRLGLATGISGVASTARALDAAS